MTIFFPGTKRNLTASRNPAVYKADDHQSVLIIIVRPKKGFFLIKRKPSKFLRKLHQKIRLTRCLYDELKHIFRIIHRGIPK